MITSIHNEKKFRKRELHENVQFNRGRMKIADSCAVSAVMQDDRPRDLHLIAIHQKIQLSRLICVIIEHRSESGGRSSPPAATITWHTDQRLWRLPQRNQRITRQNPNLTAFHLKRREHHSVAARCISRACRSAASAGVCHYRCEQQASKSARIATETKEKTANAYFERKSREFNLNNALQ